MGQGLFSRVRKAEAGEEAQVRSPGHQSFTEHLLCAQRCARLWELGFGEDRVPILMEHMP